MPLQKGEPTAMGPVLNVESISCLHLNFCCRTLLGAYQIMGGFIHAQQCVFPLKQDIVLTIAPEHLWTLPVQADTNCLHLL